MHGGTTTSGNAPASGVSGAYWINCITSFSYTTAPSVVAMLRPISKTDSSVIEMRPFPKSPIRLLIPSVMLRPSLSSATLMNSGLVAA